VFIGVIDFFSTLVPGAILTYLLATPTGTKILYGEWPYLQRESAEFWVVFLVVAYVLGHLVAALGEAVLDRMYYRWYEPSYHAAQQSVQHRFPSDPTCWEVLANLTHVKCESRGKLHSAATELKSRQLRKLGRAPNIQPEDITDTYSWAGTVVRMKVLEGTAEISNLSGQSKKFRGIVLVVPFAAAWTNWLTPKAILVWFLLFGLALCRYAHLKLRATERTYEYFIATSILDRERPSEQPRRITRQST
jgi:hypothetical protein